MWTETNKNNLTTNQTLHHSTLVRVHFNVLDHCNSICAGQNIQGGKKKKFINCELEKADSNFGTHITSLLRDLSDKLLKQSAALKKASMAHVWKLFRQKEYWVASQNTHQSFLCLWAQPIIFYERSCSLPSQFSVSLFAIFTVKILANRQGELSTFLKGKEKKKRKLEFITEIKQYYQLKIQSIIFK